MVRTAGDSKYKTARRKPLRDVSNKGVKSFKSSTKKTHCKMGDPPPPPQQQQHSDTSNNNNEDSLDRLLLVHSDISSILHQIDELVVQAVNVDTTDYERIAEIKSFTAVLSEIHSSLKLWVPRLQKAIDVSYSESQFCETRVGDPLVADQGDSHAINTPEPTKYESLVSPSPLVSWRATGCVEEKGKQLFFLTPLLRPKTITSKAPASSKITVSDGIPSIVNATFSSPCADDKSIDVKVKVVSENLEGITNLPLLSAQEISVGHFSTNLITPCPKNPPLKTVLHEPGHDLSYRKISKSHKSTPFPTGNRNLCESTDSDSSSGEVQEKLGLKYPELIGIKPSCMSKNGSRALEASPAWIVSPPKCCTLLEPLDEKEKHPKDYASLQEIATTFNQQLFLAPKESRTDTQNQDEESKSICLQGNVRSNFAKVESTPLWKGSASTIHRGKRPGENTLKRELWTRFEAATSSDCHLNLPVFKDTSHKGFLERLEEASCDESNVDPDACR